jgi:glutaredoxin
MTSKTTPFLLIGGLIVILFVFLVFARLNRGTFADIELYNEVSPSADLAVDFTNHNLYLFSRENCPHCQNVKNYLASESTLTTTTRDLVEISLDSSLNDAAIRGSFERQLLSFAQSCELDMSTVGVPFLYLNDTNLNPTERCLLGDTDVIAYLQAHSGTASE